MSCCVGASLAEPLAISPRWQASFLGTTGEQQFETTAVAMTGDSILVVVMVPGADLTRLKLQLGNRSIPFKVIGHDPVSRLGFIGVEGSVTPKANPWAAEAGANFSSILQSMEPEGPAKCQTTGWVKQVGGKVFPLALLRATFSRNVPPPGTPLMDGAARVVGIVFQTAGVGNVGYVIPAEAVHRVQQDICKGGRLNRGWLGLSLLAGSRVPGICRVFPNSPASAAGIRPNDQLLSIGLRQVSDYADAVNAFFYLIPGQPVRVKLLRDADQFEFTVTPTSSKG